MSPDTPVAYFLQQAELHIQESAIPVILHSTQFDDLLCVCPELDRIE